MADEHEKLAAPAEFDDGTLSNVPARGRGRKAPVVESELSRHAANIAVKPDGVVVVTNNEGAVLERYADAGTARAALLLAGVDLTKCFVAGNLGVQSKK
jgi:hypothetical protein